MCFYQEKNWPKNPVVLKFLTNFKSQCIFVLYRNCLLVILLFQVYFRLAQQTWDGRSRGFCAATGENSEKKTHLHLPPIFNPPFPLTETLVRQVLTWAFPSHCNPFLLNFKTNTFGKCWVCTFPLKTHKVQIGIHRKWKTSPGF